VLPAGGKVVRLEELEASQLSPPPTSHKAPSASGPSLVPSGSSTPADSSALASVLQGGSTVVPVDSRHSAISVGGQVGRGRGRGRIPVSVGGPVEGHTPSVGGRTLPAGAQVQTVEELEAGLRQLNMPPSPPVNHSADTGTSSAAGGGGGGDLTAFNKLLHLVNKSQPLNDQACCLCVVLSLITVTVVIFSILF